MGWGVRGRGEGEGGITFTADQGSLSPDHDPHLPILLHTHPHFFSRSKPRAQIEDLERDMKDLRLDLKKQVSEARREAQDALLK